MALAAGPRLVQQRLPLQRRPWAAAGMRPYTVVQQRMVSISSCQQYNNRQLKEQCPSSYVPA
jgi:hypothetical protein